MKALIPLLYENTALHASREAWFNATEIAAMFGKRPIDWLRLPETEKYIEALIRREASKQAEVRKSRIGKSDFIKTYKGGNDLSKQGTWLHPKLAIAFARWCDVDFAVWCDETINELLINNRVWTYERKQAAHDFKVMAELIRATKESKGQEPKRFDYINEAKRVNRALTGIWQAIDRESLNAHDLKLLHKLEIQNGVLYAQGYTPAQRNEALAQTVAQTRQTPTA